MKLTAPAQPAEPGPRLSVLAVVTRATSRGSEVLLVRRANPPQPGHWGFPGGKVDWGEGLCQAAIRELKEETAIDGANPVAFDTVDLIVPKLSDGGAGRPYHHLMVAVRLDWPAGEPVAGEDRTRVVSGTRGLVRVDLGGRRNTQKNKTQKTK